MHFFKSIQFKAMLCMVVVACVCVVVIHEIYQVWLMEAEEEAMQERVERALFSYGPAAADDKEMYSRIVLLARRFELSGVALVDPQSRTTLVNIGGAPQSAQLRHWLAQPPAADVLHAGLSDQDEEAPEIWGARRIEGVEGRSLLLAVAVPRGRGLVTRRVLDSISWLTLGGAVVIALLLSYLLRQLVVRPVERFSKALAHVAHGDLTHRMDRDVDRELVQLADDFNHMLAELATNRAKVEEYQNSLEQRVEEARQELARKEAELIQAEKLASVGQLAAGVAHEINNPIYTITLTADLLRKDVDDAASQKRVEQIAAQARRCRKIVGDLLEYSRQGPPMEGALDVNATLRASVEQLADQGRLERVTTDLQLAEDMPLICGMQDEIRRVVDIILLNALQAFEDGGRIAIQTRCTQDHQIQVVITDDGPGMSQEVLGRAFEPFFTTKQVGQGTGLGLSIAYGIVMRHHGKLTLASRPGEGTTVTMCLPAEAPDASAPADDGGSGDQRKDSGGRR